MNVALVIGVIVLVHTFVEAILESVIPQTPRCGPRRIPKIGLVFCKIGALATPDYGL